MFLSYRENAEKKLIEIKDIERIIVLEGREQYLFSFNPENASDVKTEVYNDHGYSYMFIMKDGSPQEDILVNEIRSLENDLGERKVEQVFQGPSQVIPKAGNPHLHSFENFN